MSSAEAIASTTVTVSVTVTSGPSITGGDDVVVTTHGYGRSKAIAGNAGGGAISIGDSAGEDRVRVDSSVTLQGSTTVTAIDDVVVRAFGDVRPSVFSSTDQGGFIGGSFGETSAYADWNTVTTSSGTVSAGDRATVEGSHLRQRLRPLDG